MAGFKETGKEIAKDLMEMRKQSRRLFVDMAQTLRRDIVSKFYSGAARDSVGRRTGRAAKSWVVEKIREDSNELVISVNSSGVPYADFRRIKNVNPKTSKWLVIPVGPALTRSGVARYPGDGDGKGSIAQAEKAMTLPPIRRTGSYIKNQFSGKPRSPFAWIHKSGSIFVVAKPGVKGPGITTRNRLLFVLKKSVKVPAYTRGLMPFIDRKENELFSKIGR